MRDIKKNIKDAAYRLLSAKDGYKVTTEDIIKKAGIAKASFYVYYRDKYQLMSDMFLEQLNDIYVFTSPIDFSSMADRYEIIINNYFDFIRNVVLSDKYNYVMIDITNFIEKRVSDLVIDNKGDMNDPIMKHAVHRMCLSSVLLLYETASNKISVKEFSNYVREWPYHLPKCIADYFNL